MSSTSFDHVRARDGERVGTIVVTDDGLFVPFDVLGRQRAEPCELDEAEAVLDEIGIGMLADAFWLVTQGTDDRLVRLVEVHRDHVVVAPQLDDSSTFAKSIDPTQRVVVPIPTDRLREA